MSEENNNAADDNAISSPAQVTEAPAVEKTVDAEVSATETTEEPKKVNKVQTRINQLTRERYEAKQETDGLRKKVAQLEANQKPEAPSQPDIKAPNEDDFDTDSEFQQANATFIADNAVNKAYAKIQADNDTRDQAGKATAREAELTDKKSVFEKNVDSKRQNFEDFEDVAYGHSFMDRDIAEQIFDMDKGPEVAYHLGSNLDVAEKIFALIPVQRARELTKLEFQVEALKPKLVSGAPDPITPIGSGQGADPDPDNMTADEWQAWRNGKVGMVNG